MDKVAIITGCSSGIGLETAIHLTKNGFRVFATMRNLEKADSLKKRAESENLNIEISQLDVTDDLSVKNAVSQMVNKTGRIDVLVNNAGYAIIGAAEDLSSEELQAQFDTNVFGVFRTTRAVLPTMRNQKSGKIITISSIAGFSGFPSMSAYCSTKFAIEGFTESLRYELGPFGISACVIEPGVIKTPIMETAPIAKKTKDGSAYSEMIQKIGMGIRGMMENQSSPPLVVAEAVLKAATAENPEIRYTAGDDAKMLAAARNSKSDEEFEEMIKTSFLSAE